MLKFAEGLRQGMGEALVAAMFREAGNQAEALQVQINRQAATANDTIKKQAEEIEALKAEAEKLQQLVAMSQRAAEAPIPPPADPTPIRPKRGNGAHPE